MKKIYNYLIAAVFFCTPFVTVDAQQSVVLDLNRTIELANDSSLEAFRTQNITLKVLCSNTQFTPVS
jgi:hypothetical protein